MELFTVMYGAIGKSINAMVVRADNVAGAKDVARRAFASIGYGPDVVVFGVAFGVVEVTL